jgi:hypothetical protein
MPDVRVPGPGLTAVGFGTAGITRDRLTSHALAGVCRRSTGL